MIKSILETASWIAAIIGTLIAIYTGFSSTKSGTSTSLPSTQTTIPVQATATVKEPETLIRNSYPKNESSSISVALTAAIEIYGTNDRDIELERLAHIAIKRDEFKAALDATKYIYNTTRRDEVLELINCYAVCYGNFKIAKEATDNAYSTKTRTNMLLKISKTSSTKLGEGENSADCKAF